MLKDCIKKYSLRKRIASGIAIVAGCVTIASFVLVEMRRSDELKKSDEQMECITSAIGEIVEVTREYSSNESARISALESSSMAQKHSHDSAPMWPALVHVSGTKNSIKFVASTGREGVPKEIGGVRTRRVVPIPDNCLLTIHLSGVKNTITIDEKLRGRVTISGKGVGCTASWVK